MPRRVLAPWLPCLALGFTLGVALPAQVRAQPPDQPLPRFVNKGPGAPKGRSDSGDAYSRLRASSRDPAYGYTQGRPVEVGGARDHTDQRAILYLNALRGPAGQPISWVRLGTCCYFTPLQSSLGAIGLLNVYSLTYDGLPTPLLLYLDIYDTGPGLVPVGLTARRD